MQVATSFRLTPMLPNMRPAVPLGSRNPIWSRAGARIETSLSGRLRWASVVTDQILKVRAHDSGAASAEKLWLAMLVDCGRTCRPAVIRCLAPVPVRKLKVYRRFPYAWAVYVAPYNASAIARVGSAQSRSPWGRRYSSGDDQPLGSSILR
jgi:hypothetical protein